jgi:hypothetical protein
MRTRGAGFPIYNRTNPSREGYSLTSTRSPNCFSNNAWRALAAWAERVLAAIPVPTGPSGTYMFDGMAHPACFIALPIAWPTSSSPLLQVIPTRVTLYRLRFFAHSSISEPLSAGQIDSVGRARVWDGDTMQHQIKASAAAWRGFMRVCLAVCARKQKAGNGS